MAPCLPLKEQALQDCFVSALMSLTPGGALTTAWLTPLRGDRGWPVHMIFSYHGHLAAEPHEAANHTAK